MPSGHFGMPGSNRKSESAPATISSARGTENNCLSTSVLSSRSAEDRVTIMPVAIEMMSAGNCVTMPSPIVSREKRCSASPQSIPICITPMIQPAMILMSRTITPAMASPFTNLLAPSMAAIERRLFFKFGPAAQRLFLIDEAHIEIGVDAHLLTGHPIERETSPLPLKPVCAGCHHYVLHDNQDEEDNEAYQEIAADRERADRVDDIARGRAGKN